MNRRHSQNHQDRHGQENREQSRNRHSDRGRPSYDMNNEEYDQRGGHNNDRDRDDYSNHARSRAGDRYWRQDDNRFDHQDSYGASRNYGGMGGLGGAQGFGTSRAGGSGQASAHHHQDPGRFEATSGQGRRPDRNQEYRRNDAHQPQRHIYGGIREYRRGEDEENRNQQQNRQSRGNHDRSFEHSGQISGGEFSPMLGGGPSRGWYTPTEGGYSRSGGYVGPGGVYRGSRRPNSEEDRDNNYGQTFGDDIHYDPTSQDRRDTHVQNPERRSLEKYGSERRDQDLERGWHYDPRQDEYYGPEDQDRHQYGARHQDRRNQNQGREK